MTYTQAQISDKLQTSQPWLERGIMALYAKQTEYEQQTDQTVNRNGVGFSAADAPFFSRCATWLEKGNHLNGWHLNEAKRRIKRYSRQLTNIANSKSIDTPTELVKPWTQGEGKKVSCDMCELEHYSVQSTYGEMAFKDCMGSEVIGTAWMKVHYNDEHDITHWSFFSSGYDHIIWND